ncbi:MAG: hypothetical protein CVT89_01400 [Candidatus Altiarchaeales archaeon HGW-Altiarchaeales-2]|nr:MAG: hypothetical protein CVT89_01400 [Candidatus Altiarchaeales archaeon HGW-Altiarchaeales-2]
MVFKRKYTNLDINEITEYIKTQKIVSWKDLEQRFNATKGAIRYLLRRHKLIYSLSHKGQQFTLYDMIKTKIDDDGLWIYENFVFSRWGRIEPALKQLITNSLKGYTSKDLRNKLNLGLHDQIQNLVKNKEVVRMKLGYEYIYFSTDDRIREQQIKTMQNLNPELEITPEGVIKKKCVKVKEIIDIRELKPGDYVLENLEAVRRVKSGWKKTEVARELNKSPDTIRSVYKRFEKRGVKGLIKKGKK